MQKSRSLFFLLAVVGGTGILLAGLLPAEEAKPHGRFPDKMTVTVVDEAGKPVSHAKGYYRFGNYANFKVDENGVFVIEMPTEEQLNERPTTDFTVKAEGYGPFSADFKTDPVFPETFRVVLKPARKTGGIVVDEDGKPLEGVTVRLVIHFATSYKTPDLFVTSEEMKTGADGKWSFFQLPATFHGSPTLVLKKDGYLPTQISSVPAARFNPDADGNFHEKVVIERGYALSGTVVDESGAAVEGATVTLQNWGTLGQPAQTDKDGKFRIENLPLTERVLLVVGAEGKAPQVRPAEIRSQDEPVTITLRPGRKVVFTVVDSAGKPLSGASFRLNGINGLPGEQGTSIMPLLKDAKTGADGRFVWNEAPHEPFEITCFLEDYTGWLMNVDERQTEVPITQYRAGVVLRVLDDATGEPVPHFTVITRYYDNADVDRFGSWSFPERGIGGRKEFQRYGGGQTLAWRYDVQAPGYEMTPSRKVAFDEEDVELVVRLVKSVEKPGEKPTPETDAETALVETPSFPASGGKILAPDGTAAKDATVDVFVPENPGRLEIEGVSSDENGNFLLSEGQREKIATQPFTLKITHPSGVVVLDGETFRRLHDTQSKTEAEAIRLLKWGRVEGTLQAGAKKLEGTSLSGRWTKPETLPVRPGFYWGTTTKKDGRFVVEQVMPGTITWTRMVPARGFMSSWASYCGTVEVKPGETTRCTLGGTGTAVVGKAVLPENVDPATIDFTEYTARIVPKPENLDDLVSPELPREYWSSPEPEKREADNARRLAWYQTPEGRQYKEQTERYGRATRILRFAALDADGRFRFDDLPPGEYALVISVTDNCSVDFSIGDWHLRDTFLLESPPDTAENAESLDLGDRALVKKD